MKNLIGPAVSYVTSSFIRELNSSFEENRCEEYTSFLLTTLLYSFANTNCKIEQTSSDSFKKILSYIDENISSPLSASEIAGHFGYNPAYFSRLFTKKTGMSPMEYIKYQRISLAKELLIRPYDSVGDIGLACGYPDEKYFSRLFRRSEGVTPSQYRKTNLMKNS
ncbi:MAG: AraC family transcriptional regulator [Bacillota bacterium]|nr:AraC family transcriptional regulator [Bacillota bacterium]